jgi:hypothetical protein
MRRLVGPQRTLRSRPKRSTDLAIPKYRSADLRVTFADGSSPRLAETTAEEIWRRARIEQSRREAASG